MRTACRVAGAMSATAPSSTCKSRRARSRRWLRVRSLQRQDRHRTGQAACWKSVCRDCAGTIDSLVELLQGRLDKGVMDRVCREGDGLFPSPDEIKLSCSCPDWADMCKHVAAVLYGVGARLDERPELLFVLRGVDENKLIASAGQDLPLAKQHQLRRKCSTTVMSPPCLGWRWPRPSVPIPRHRPPSGPNGPRPRNDVRCLPQQRAWRQIKATRRARREQGRTQMGCPGSCSKKARASATPAFRMIVSGLCSPAQAPRFGCRQNAQLNHDCRARRVGAIGELPTNEMRISSAPSSSIRGKTIRVRDRGRRPVRGRTADFSGSHRSPESRLRSRRLRPWPYKCIRAQARRRS